MEHSVFQEDVQVYEGANTISLSHLQDGAPDEAGNNGNLDLHKFVIDSEAPKIIYEDNSTLSREKIKNE